MFLTKANPYNTCVGYSDCLNNYPPDQILKNLYIYEEFDELETRKLLDLFDISNSDIIVTSKKNLDYCDEIEPIYDTKYSVKTMPEELKEKFNNP